MLSSREKRDVVTTTTKNISKVTCSSWGLLCISPKWHVHHEGCCVFQQNYMFIVKSVVYFKKVACSWLISLLCVSERLRVLSRRLLCVSAKIYADEEACVCNVDLACLTFCDLNCMRSSLLLSFSAWGDSTWMKFVFEFCTVHRARFFNLEFRAF